MKGTHAALVRSRGRVVLREIPTPKAASGEVVLAPDYSGVCGTDLQILRGLRTDPAAVLGHEGTATVVSVGGRVPGVEVGARVMVNPTHPSDDDFLLGHNVDGMWAQRVLIPANAVTAGLVLAADAVPATPLAALVEPLAAVMYGRSVTLAASRAAPSSLIIWGDGVIGRLARRWWRAHDRDLVVIHVHHVESGMAQSREYRMGEAELGHLEVADLLVDDPRLNAALSSITGPVAAILATPRNATADALRRVDRLCRTDVTVNVHGGLAGGAVALSAGSIDVGAVRALNRGGEPRPPASKAFARDGAGSLVICGQRGVSNAMLAAAAAELASNGAAYRDLVTHVVDMDTAADLLTSLAAGDRCFGGRRVVKAAIRVGS